MQSKNNRNEKYQFQTKSKHILLIMFPEILLMTEN